MVKKWVLVDIGCLEGGELSNVVGLYDSEKEAVKAWNGYRIAHRNTWEGQHSYIIQEVEV